MHILDPNTPTTRFCPEIAGDLFIISGSDSTLGTTFKKAGLALLCFLGALICWQWAGQSDSGPLFGFLTLTLVLVGLCQPAQEFEYVDFLSGKLVKRKWYLGYSTFHRELSLTTFGSVVLRHVCHPGGEGEDTYTGSVGLKPVERAAVRWIKEFPTTKDEVPTQSVRFARELAARLKLPYDDRFHPSAP